MTRLGVDELSEIDAGANSALTWEDGFASKLEIRIVQCVANQTNHGQWNANRTRNQGIRFARRNVQAATRYNWYQFACFASHLNAGARDEWLWESLARCVSPPALRGGRREVRGPPSGGRSFCQISQQMKSLRIAGLAQSSWGIWLVLRKARSP